MTTTEVNPRERARSSEVQANRRRLVEALTSGRYAQAHGMLRRGNGFCCLGVAEDVRGCIWQLRSNANMSKLPAHNPNNWTTLSPQAQEWLGVVNDSPFVTVWVHSRWRTHQLVTLNDDVRMSLPLIGHVIADQHKEWTGDEDDVIVETQRRNDNVIKPRVEVME
jgi:hypothetical protein